MKEAGFDEKLLMTDNVGNVLVELCGLFGAKGVDSKGEPNEFGLRIEELYDRLYDRYHYGDGTIGSEEKAYEIYRKRFEDTLKWKKSKINEDMKSGG